ncbi:MAG: ribbon-helix-helix domain-containing protein [Actinomycetia bacterium]|nr:ribbon-helix-helix domain-containing protein [Actinomycetes bacterium]
MSEHRKLTREEYAEMAQSYEDEPPRRDEMVGEPYVAASAMQVGRPRGGGEPRGASPARAVRLPAEVDEALADQAARDGVSVSEAMRDAVVEYLDRHSSAT